MSQYPAPYSPPPGAYAQQMYWDPRRDLLAPARRASVLMFVYGGVLMLCGGCSLVSAAFSNSPENMQRMQEIMPGVEPASPRLVAIVAGVLLGIAILLVALGAWVRTGRRAPLITTATLVGLILLVVLLGLIGNVAAGLEPAVLAVTFCVNIAFIGAPMALLLVWLIQAMGNSGRLAGAQAYAQGYWQYPQQYPQQYPPGYPPPEYGQPGAAGPHVQPGGPAMIPAPPLPPAPPASPGVGGSASDPPPPQASPPGS